MEQYIGEIRMVSFKYAPDRWALCNGQALPVNKNQALYSLIGNTYGGDTTNFNLPNLQGRVPVHVNSGTGMLPNSIPAASATLAASGGLPGFILTQAQMPAHTHDATFKGTGGGGSYTPPNVTVTVQGSSAAGTQSSPTGNYLAGSVATAPAKNLFVPGTAAGTLGNIAGVSAVVTGGSGGGITGGTVTNAVVGGTTPVNNLTPYLVVYFIIAISGEYPMNPN